MYRPSKTFHIFSHWQFRIICIKVGLQKNADSKSGTKRQKGRFKYRNVTRPLARPAHPRCSRAGHTRARRPPSRSICLPRRQTSGGPPWPGSCHPRCRHLRR
eukprot:scaffold672916_cov74-Prasinocladus_malaysianus.AAC.1